VKSVQGDGGRERLHSEVVFLGYCPQQSAYRCLDLSTNPIFVSRHVIFDETTFPFSANSSQPVMSIHLKEWFPLPVSIIPFTGDAAGTTSSSVPTVVQDPAPPG